MTGYCCTRFFEVVSSPGLRIHGKDLDEMIIVTLDIEGQEVDVLYCPFCGKRISRSLWSRG